MKRKPNIIRDALTIAEKQMKLSLRFKIPYFTGVLINPLIRIVPFLLVYYGFFVSGGATSFMGITAENYIPFLTLGMLVDVFLNMGYGLFAGHFGAEKVWHTIEATLLAPINKLSLIIGLSISQVIAVAPTVMMFLILNMIFSPTNIAVLPFTIFMLLCALSIAASVGLIYGALVMANENFGPFFGYFRTGWVFISCFYYPLNILLVNMGGLTVDFRIFAFLNPIFHVADIVRSIWLGTIDMSINLSSNPGLVLGSGWNEIALPLLFVIGCAIALPIISVWVFNRLWKKMGIQGY